MAMAKVLVLILSLFSIHGVYWFGVFICQDVVGLAVSENARVCIIFKVNYSTQLQWMDETRRFHENLGLQFGNGPNSSL